MNKKIILVEDELFVRELYERVLKQAGFDTFGASDGQAGLELIQRESRSDHKPDLILLDIMMPKLNGIDVLKELKIDDSTKDVPVILLTNLGQGNVIREAFKLGAKGYLMKIRVTPYQMVEHVKDFIDNPNLQMNPDQLDLE